MTQLRFRAGFDWGRVARGRPDSPVRPFCAYCSAFIDENEVPIMIWKDDGSAARFCDACIETWMEAT
jgi:hypothetical protein